MTKSDFSEVRFGSTLFWTLLILYLINLDSLMRYFLFLPSYLVLSLIIFPSLLSVPPLLTQEFSKILHCLFRFFSNFTFMSVPICLFTFHFNFSQKCPTPAAPPSLGPTSTCPRMIIESQRRSGA